MYLVDGDSISGPDVVRAGKAGSGDGHHAVDEIGDVDVVAFVVAIAEYCDLASVEHRLQENSDYAGFSVRVLSGTVSICGSDDAVVESVEMSIDSEVVFDCEFGGAVGGERLSGHTLARRQGSNLDVAVDGAAGREVNETGRSVQFSRGFEEVERPVEVYVNV